MKKEILLVLVLIALIGAALFYDQVWAFFRGMGPLEAIQMIWQFVLHVTVGTILAYVLYTLPEIVKPWLRVFRQKQRQARRLWRSGPNAQWKSQTPRAPRLNASQQFWLMMARANGRTKPPAARFPAQPGTGNENEPTMRIKW
jgi:hypothetical protein